MDLNEFISRLDNADDLVRIRQRRGANIFVFIIGRGPS